METSILTMAERTCKDCGALLEPRREDRQYCGPACKTNYNNRRRKEQQELAGAGQLSVPDYITRIQEIQLRNRQILENLRPEEKPVAIRMRDLLGKGFNPKFFTSEAEPAQSSGHVYRFCFEYGYWLDGDHAVVVHREREVL